MSRNGPETLNRVLPETEEFTMYNVGFKIRVTSIAFLTKGSPTWSWKRLSNVLWIHLFACLGGILWSKLMLTYSPGALLFIFWQRQKYPWMAELRSNGHQQHIQVEIISFILFGTYPRVSNKCLTKNLYT